jgi:hypothetical protein
MPNLTAKKAADAAIAYLKSIYDAGAIQQLTLEEVEYDHDFGGRWLLTFSFINNTKADPFNFGALQTRDREFKVFTINDKTGEVESMKIRTV